MLIDRIARLAQLTSVTTPAKGDDGVGYKRSRADWMLDQMEQHLRINDTSGSLRERTDRIATHLGE